jgi:hypothetical protein
MLLLLLLLLLQICSHTFLEKIEIITIKGKAYSEQAFSLSFPTTS